MDKLWAMEVFVRVLECGSFSRAAESLDLANATVTSSLRNLEKHLGVTLIQRNTRHLRLTEEGELFLPKCREILKNVAQVESDVKLNSAEVSGMLRVESPFGFGQTLLCPNLPELTRRHPNLRIAVNLTNETHSLIERATDVAIRMDKVEEADLVARPIYETHHIVCGTPAMVAKLKCNHPKQLNPKYCLGIFNENYQTPNPWTLSKGEDGFSIRPEGALTFNNTQALIQAALNEVGLIYVLDVFVDELLASGKLVQMFPDWQTSKRTFHAVTVKSRFASPKVRAFLDFLPEIFDISRRPNIKTQVAVGPTRKKRKPA